MMLNQRLVLLLLLGFTVSSVVAADLCVLSEDMTRCVCNIMAIYKLQNLICLQALELELRDGKLGVSVDTVLGSTLAFQFFRINKLIFNNVTIPFSLILAVMPFLPVNLNEINIISSTLEVQPFGNPGILGESKIKALLLEDITVDPSLLEPSFQAFHHWLFRPLKSFGLVRSGLVEIDCYWARRAENLTHLDLSENPISNLSAMRNCRSLSFKYLKSLGLRHSSLSSLQSLCTLLSLAPALTELDVSRNNFSIFHYPHCLQARPLRTLSLSHSGITEVNAFLSASLEELDLSYNSLEVFNDPPKSLKRLNLSNNRLRCLPPLNILSNLQELKVDSNQLTVLVNDTGVSLSTLEQLDVLRAGRNPYHCDCALKETIVFLNNTDSVSEDDFPNEFLCATPVSWQGTQIMTLSLETCVKPNGGTQRHAPLLCLTLVLGLLSCQSFLC